jgi:glycine/D-amino acid oxidase-like deaminating enzyme
LAGALFVKEDAAVYPPWVAHFLVREAQRFGAELIPGHRVVAISGSDATLDDGATLSSRNFVLANGTSAPLLASGIHLQPRKGHLAITDPHPGFLRHQLIELAYLKSAHATTSDSVAFNVQPRPSGQVLIGSSRQYGNSDNSVEESIIASMLARANEYMPGLAKLRIVRSWTGFRAATPDKLPLIGPHPAIENVYLATGHEGLGITTSLGTAKLIADHLLQRKSAIDPTPYLPGRSRAAEG